MNESDQLVARYQRPALMALLLAAATFALFAPAIGYRFINYDDGLYVYENARVLGGLNGAGVTYAFTTFDFGNWMPLTWLSLMLDTTLFGKHPSGYHLTAVLLHVASTALLFLALQRLTKSFWRSAFVAAVFAFHPLRQESVVWVAERKGTLSTLFWMLGLLAYARYAEKPGARRYGVVALCLSLGLAAKSMLITFPAVLLLLDFWPLRRMGETWPELRAKFWPLLREKLPLFAVCFVMTGITYWTQQHAGAVGHAPPAPLQKIAHVTDNYTFYLQKIFWPGGLAIPYAKAATGWLFTVTGAVILLGVTLLACAWWRQKPWLFVGWFWFLGTFVPVVGLIQISHVFVADRYTYIPSIGLAIMVAWVLGELAEKFPTYHRLLVLVAVLLCAGAATANRATLARWTDPVTLFTASIRHSPHQVACNNVASALVSRGDFDAAIHYATLGIALETNAPGPFNTRGLAYNGKGELDAALRDYSEAIARGPELAEAWNNRGNTHVRKDELDLALVDFNEAIKLKPDFSEAWNNVAFIWYSRSNYSEALTSCTRALEIHPADASAYNNRARVFLAQKDYENARADLSRCRQLGGEPNAELLQALREATGKVE